MLVAAKLFTVSNVVLESNVNAGSAPKKPSLLYCTSVLAPAAVSNCIVPQAKLPVPSTVARTSNGLPPVIRTLDTSPKLVILLTFKLFAVSNVLPLSKVNPESAPNTPSSLN